MQTTISKIGNRKDWVRHIAYIVQKKGFTLIEMLAVILIIGLLTFIAIPTFSKFGSNARLKSTASQVASLLRMARNLATTNNASYTMTIYPRGTTTPNQIVIRKTSDNTQVEKIWSAAPLVEIPDITGSTSAQNIIFSSYGTTTTAYSIHIIQKGTLINGSAYSASGSYASLGKSERVKCFTVMVDNTTGVPNIYYYGRNAPWANTDL